MYLLPIHHQNIFLSCLGVIFCSAFLSYYLQFPGLVSSSGIEPAARSLKFAFPKLNQLIVAELGEMDDETYMASVDILCECSAILGVILSCLVSRGIIQHGLVVALITALYCFLVKLGGTFYSFQWDILLLETGFITSLCYSPWSQRNFNHFQEKFGSGAWPMRFLLFKLMFMSGVVKVLADCPTWSNLTALEYHFATQCLPGPFAWYAHQLHPFFLRLSVAVTLLIEIPAAFLLLVPMPSWRRLGAYLQLILQIMIILSGNYNFFNILTMVLCVPCFQEDIKSNTTKEVAASEFRKSRYDYMSVSVSFVFLAWCFGRMFTIEGGTLDKWNIFLNMTKHDSAEIIQIAVPSAIICTFMFLSYSSYVNGRNLAKTKKGIFNFASVKFTIHTVICYLCIGIISVPFLTLVPGLAEHSGMALSRMFINSWNQVQPYGFSNGYGLFRRMTGVGKNNIYKAPSYGWAGVAPSIVERPEIILEGFSEKDKEWKELNFRWKPGNVYSMPGQVAPHQPRLDWQMWFAALGSYHHSPWFINFVNKLLDGCKPVVKLIDEVHLMNDEDTLLAIRATLYEYDFTRIENKWNKRIPGVEFISNNHEKKKWWRRKQRGDYLPVLESGNDSVNLFLANHGLSSKCFYDEKDKCNDIFAHSSISLTLCNFCSFVRKCHLVWTPLILLLINHAITILRRS